MNTRNILIGIARGDDHVHDLIEGHTGGIENFGIRPRHRDRCPREPTEPVYRTTGHDEISSAARRVNSFGSPGPAPMI